MVDKNNISKDYFNKHKEWFVTLVIPTINRQDILLDLIKMISMQNVLPKEVFIFDQSDNINISKKDIEKFSNLNLKYFRLDRKNKQTALNWGLKLSNYPIYINIDDDVIIQQDFIYNHLLSLYEHNADVISGASIREGSDYIDNHQIRKPQFWEPSHLYFLQLNSLKKPYSCLIVSGNNASFKKSVLLEVSGWDDQLGRLPDDDDISMIMFNHGKVFYDPRPKVFIRKLKGGWTHRKWEVPRSGLVYFLRKHFSKSMSIFTIFLYVIRGEYLSASYRLTTFLTTPLRFYYSLKNWIISSAMLKKGPQTIDRDSFGNIDLFYENK